MSIQNQIIAALDGIEATEQVRILYACESGSRAWGFASPDSDYDVRFIYVRPLEWYLSIDCAKRRDVIELPIERDLDVNGWDLPKTLTLYHKTNPPLYEWLGSPIVYRDVCDLHGELMARASRYYCPRAAIYHYLRMAQNNWNSYLQVDPVRTKKYLYALRPLLAALWIERGMGVVPTTFQDLVQGVVDDARVRAAIEALLERKHRMSESAVEPPIPVLHAYLAQHLERLETVANDTPAPRGPIEELNALFRTMLQRVWGP